MKDFTSEITGNDKSSITLEVSDGLVYIDRWEDDKGILSM